MLFSIGTEERLQKGGLTPLTKQAWFPLTAASRAEAVTQARLTEVLFAGLCAEALAGIADPTGKADRPPAHSMTVAEAIAAFKLDPAKAGVPPATIQARHFKFAAWQDLLGPEKAVSPEMNSSATCRLNAALWDRCFVMASILRWQAPTHARTVSA